jgi:hypothetical protein
VRRETGDELLAQAGPHDVDLPAWFGEPGVLAEVEVVGAEVSGACVPPFGWTTTLHTTPARLHAGGGCDDGGTLYRGRVRSFLSRTDAVVDGATPPG